MSARRIAIAASEILGMPRAGGAATADSLLAVALGREGHDVELLIAPGRALEVDRGWRDIYSSSGVAVRPLERRLEVEPPFLAPAMTVFHALRADPPDVVVADDWRGLAYAALSARRVGLAFADTAFVVHCHGPARMLAEFAQKVPDTLARFGEEVAERASIELADAVVSPSEWLLEWMRDRGWPRPRLTRVVQYLRESVSLGQAPPPAPTGGPIRRLAFFGQLREGKGIRVFLDSLELLDPKLLEGIELLFLGSPTRRWTPERIEGSLPPGVAKSVASVRVEIELDRSAALEQLRAAGTLAVMPSLLDNSPNTVSECIEHGVPFLASGVGGIPELMQDADRERVLVEPNAEALAAALREALESPSGVAPAAAARGAQESLDAWLELIDSVAPARTARSELPARIALVTTGGTESERRARHLVETTRSVEVEVVPAPSRAVGAAQATGDWLVFLDDQTAPDDELVDVLARGRVASGADVITCAVRASEQQDDLAVFLGNPGALGLTGNHYGVLGLIRRSLLDGMAVPDGAGDPSWPLFARLALAGARIAAIPEPLATYAGRPGRLGDVPGEGLAVLEAFEEYPGPLQGLPQLTATLAASHDRGESRQEGSAAAPDHLLQRGVRVLQAEGIRGVVRRARAHLG